MHPLSLYIHDLIHYQNHSPEWHIFFFFAKDEPILTHHYHSKSIVYFRVHSVLYSVGLDKHITTCIYLCSTIHSIFTALKILCSRFCMVTLSPLPMNSCQLLIFLLSPSLPFPECHIVWKCIVCSPFRLASFM